MPKVFVVAFDILVYLLAVIIAYKNKNRNTSNASLWILALLFCLFAAWGGDYAHYKEIFHLVKHGSDSHLEPPYLFLIQHVVDYYFFFRLIVWGGALLLFHLAIKKIRIPESFILFVFIIIALPRFSYARASLAMAIMTFGSVIIASNKPKHLIGLIIGLLIAAFSIYFHKSAAFGVAVIALSLALKRFISKPLLICVFAIFPIALYYLKDLLVDYMMVESFEESMVNISSGQRYLVGEISAVKGPATLIEEGLMRVSFYLVAVLFILSVIKNKYKELPETIKFFACCSFFTIAGASLFAFDTGFDTSTIFNRFLLYSILPSSIFVAHFIYTKQFQRFTRLIIIVGLCASFFALLYSFYCTLVA